MRVPVAAEGMMPLGIPDYAARTISLDDLLGDARVFAGRMFRSEHQIPSTGASVIEAGVDHGTGCRCHRTQDGVRSRQSSSGS